MSYWRKRQKILDILFLTVLIISAIILIPIVIIGFFFNRGVYYRVEILLLMLIIAGIISIVYILSAYADKKVKEL